MKKHYITASELGEYVFCACCWMDSCEEKRIQTKAMEQGTFEHDTINWNVSFLIQIRNVLLILILIILILLVAAFGLQLFFHYSL
jgi:hypothetical protein